MDTFNIYLGFCLISNFLEFHKPVFDGYFILLNVFHFISELSYFLISKADLAIVLVDIIIIIVEKVITEHHHHHTHLHTLHHPDLHLHSLLPPPLHGPPSAEVRPSVGEKVPQATSTREGSPGHLCPPVCFCISLCVCLFFCICFSVFLSFFEGISVKRYSYVCELFLNLVSKYFSLLFVCM